MIAVTAPGLVLDFGGSVGPGQRGDIQRALDDSLFPMGMVPIDVRVEVVPLALHNGNVNAATTILQQAGVNTRGSAKVQFSQGLWQPGSPLYLGPEFVAETVLHEFGHVVTLGCGTDEDYQAFCAMLGIDFGTQWDPKNDLTGDAWLHAGKEAVAETFKDMFARPANRRFTNRTDFKLPAWAQPYFAAQCIRPVPYVKWLLTLDDFAEAGTGTSIDGPFESKFAIAPENVDGCLSAGFSVTCSGGSFPSGQGLGFVLRNTTTAVDGRALGGETSPGGAPGFQYVDFDGGAQNVIMLTIGTDGGETWPDVEVTWWNVPPLPNIQLWPYPLNQSQSGDLAHSTPVTGVVDR